MQAQLNFTFDLGSAAGCRDAVRHVILFQKFQKLDGTRQRPSLRRELHEEFTVTTLKRFRFFRRELASDLACDCPCEQSAAHPDPAVNPPSVDRHPGFFKCLLPREHMRINRVDERSVEVKYQCVHD